MKHLTRTQAKRAFARLLQKKLDEGMRDQELRDIEALRKRTRKPTTKRVLKKLERGLKEIKRGRLL